MNLKQKPSFIRNRKVAFLATFFYVFVQTAIFAQGNSVKIGVLALRGYEESMNRWKPSAEYLSDQITEYTFVIVPLNFEEIYDAVEQAEIDFVLTNLGIYVDLEYKYGIDRIATLNDLWQGQAFHEFGGVIFTQKNREDITNLCTVKYFIEEAQS